MAEHARGQSAEDAHPLVGDGQEKIVGAVVVLGEIERGAGGHVKQCGMLAKCCDIGGESFIEFDLCQALAVAYVKPAQRLPARPKIELALLPGAVIFVKDNFPLIAARREGGAIDQGVGA